MSNLYVVNKGDSLTKIAQSHKTTVEELVRLNKIENPDCIFTGQELVLTEKTSNKKTDYAANEQQIPSTDTFTSQNDKTGKNSNKDLMLAGAAGGAAVLAGQKIFSESAEIADNAKQAALKNKKSVRAFVAKKAEKVKTGAKHIYNTAKEGVQNKTSKVAKKVKKVKTDAKIKYYMAKDRVSKKADNIKQKTKQTTRKTKINTYVGKKKVVKYGKKGIKYANRIAPKIVKGASKAAAPVAALYSVYEIGTAYKKGGTDAAVKTTIKVGAGLAVGYAGAKLGAAVGAAGGPVGMLIGGAIGGVAGYIAGEYFGKSVTS